jgi:hypothetical protein
MDDVAEQLVKAVPGSVFARPGEPVVVFCEDTKSVIAMLHTILQELTTPKDQTIQ